ncbi:MAG: type II toxin-antitoxin system RelE/ParE family toxin [Treponema sp.]|nr:type II toxin-antitoxin system RelE/ParE family toxin [Treponema sp.]
MGDFGKILDEQKFLNESDGVYAFKSQPDRYLCFFKKRKKIIVTNAYRKQTQKLPKSEKDLALKNMADYLVRNPDTKETK